MERAQLRTMAVGVLDDLAPGAGAATLSGGELLQEALDLDSFDFLTFVQRLHDATGVEIPELDYPEVATLDGVIDYLDRHRGR
ncbi:MAG TPA: acyl carrier protein [Acidimicrobiales bacterium]|nr:acyl carrier protein [Acidimicrobiales bacterium]